MREAVGKRLVVSLDKLYRIVMLILTSFLVPVRLSIPKRHWWGG